MTENLFSVIARVRRAMPRNADVMAVCEAAELGLINSDHPDVARAIEGPEAKVTPRPKPVSKARARRGAKP